MFFGLVVRQTAVQYAYPMVSELPEDVLGAVCRFLASGDTYHARHELGRHFRRSWYEVLPELRELARQLLDGIPPPQPLLELTAAIELSNASNRPTPEEMLQMAENYTVEERVAAFALACILRQTADYHCDRVHAGQCTCEHVLSLLPRECPGYSKHTYDEACKYGMINTK